jgi:Cu+-exporting ATPase
MTETESQTKMPTKVVDPVCGMTILPEKAVDTQEYNGDVYYFCGRSCLEKLKADPARYATPKLVDPVCGMEVDPTSTAAMEEHGGTRYFFCSQDVQRSSGPIRASMSNTGSLSPHHRRT